MLFLVLFIPEAAVQNKCQLGQGAGSQGRRRDFGVGVTCAALKRRRGKAPRAAKAKGTGRLKRFLFHLPYRPSYEPVSLLPACTASGPHTAKPLRPAWSNLAAPHTPQSRPGSFTQVHWLGGLGAGPLKGIIGGPCCITQGSSDLAPLTFGAASFLAVR